MNYTIFNPATGEITGIVQLSHSNYFDNNIDHTNYIEGAYSNTEYYIQDGTAQLKPAYPTDGLPYTFDYETKDWALNVELAQNYMKAQRNELLSTIDKINPIWYSTLTYEQQQDLITYRQALLDVPQQANFPHSIIWPIQPDWI